MREPQEVDAALDALARVTVRADAVEPGVRYAMAEARRRARPEPARRPSGWWLGLGLSTAFAAGFAAAAVIIAPLSAPVVETPAISPRVETADGSVVEIETGLWIHASRDAVVQTARADDAVDFRLERGTLGVRLFKGEGRPRRTITVWSGEVQVRATGTIFSVTRTRDGTVAHVTEGTVEVERDDEVVEVSAGQVYDAGDVRPADEAPAAHDALAAVSAPSPFESPSRRTAETAPAPTGPPAAEPPGSKPRLHAPRPSPAPAPEPAPNRETQPTETPAETEAPSTAELWRTARRLLAEQREAEAIESLQRAAAADDPVWAPIAGLEFARVHLRRGQTERAADAAENVLDRFPDHALAPEARSILCRADRSRHACEDRPTDD